MTGIATTTTTNTVALMVNESDVTTYQDLPTEVELLQTNIRDFVSVNMANDDYTMTYAEATCAVINVLGAVTGKTLTWPSSADGNIPANQIVITLFSGGGDITIASETGGLTGTLLSGTVHQVTIIPGLAAINLDLYTATDSRNASNGITALPDPDTSLTDALLGRLLNATGAAAQTLTIDTGLLTADAKVSLYCSGAGGITVTAGAGVTVTGNAVLATGDSCTIYRDGTTETYICV